MNIHHNIILALLEELSPKHPNYTLRAYRGNHNTGIDIHAKKGGRATMLMTREHGLQIIVDFDHRPVIDYNDPEMLEKIELILNQILK